MTKATGLQSPAYRNPGQFLLFYESVEPKLIGPVPKPITVLLKEGSK